MDAWILRVLREGKKEPFARLFLPLKLKPPGGSRGTLRFGIWYGMVSYTWYGIRCIRIRTCTVHGARSYSVVLPTAPIDDMMTMTLLAGTVVGRTSDETPLFTFIRQDFQFQPSSLSKDF